MLPTKWLEENLKLCLSEIGVFYALALDFVEQFQRPCTDTFVLRSFGMFVECCALSMAFSQLFLPKEQRPSFNLEGIHRGIKAMLLPEDQNLEFPLGFVGEHTVPPYRSVVAGDEMKAFECRLETSSSHRSG